MLPEPLCFDLSSKTWINVKRTRNYYQYIKKPLEKCRSLYLKNNFCFHVIKHQKSICKQNSEGTSARKTAGPTMISWNKPYKISKKKPGQNTRLDTKHWYVRTATQDQAKSIWPYVLLKTMTDMKCFRSSWSTCVSLFFCPVINKNNTFRKYMLLLAYDSLQRLGTSW